MAGAVRLKTARGRWVLAATIAGSGMAQLDGTVVNVALARIGEEFHAGFTALQWIVNAYTLTLAALILLGGVLGDRLGRRRIFLIGVVWFAVASALCALAPGAGVLIAARALQGVGGALLTPGSLAIISSVFASEDQPKAVGLWAGLGGLSGAIGPFLGGWLVAIDWRLVFLINLPLAAVVVFGTLRHVPESRDLDETGRLDVTGTVAIVACLTGLTWSLTEAGSQGWNVAVIAAGVAGLAAGVVFVLLERRSDHPLVPLEIFGNRVFSATNIATFFVYGALSTYAFLVILQLQVVAGWSPLLAGTSMLPLTILMLLLSSRAGDLAVRTGPRVLMTGGILLAAGSFALAAWRIGPDAHWSTDVAPSAVLLGLGLAAAVAPLTATVLAAAPEQLSGAASGVNNAVARTAGLLAVAVVPALAGLSSARSNDPSALQRGFPIAMLIGAGALVVGAGVSWFGLGKDAKVQRASESSAEPVNR